jgi:hypothetical protein
VRYDVSVSEQRDPSFLKTPPKAPPAPDPYRTLEKPRRPPEPEPEPEPVKPAVLKDAPRKTPAPPKPEEDPKEAIFRAKLAAAHAANRREANGLAIGSLGMVVLGSMFIVWELFLSPNTLLVIRRGFGRSGIPVIAIVIPAVVIAAGYLLHYVLRRAQGKTL